MNRSRPLSRPAPSSSDETLIQQRGTALQNGQPGSDNGNGSATEPRTKGRAPHGDYETLLPPQIDSDGNPVLSGD
jgi:hypothetical protein